MKSKLILFGGMAMFGFFLSSCVSLGIAMEKLIDAKVRAKVMRTTRTSLRSDKKAETMFQPRTKNTTLNEEQLFETKQEL